MTEDGEYVESWSFRDTVWQIPPFTVLRRLLFLLMLLPAVLIL